MATFRITDPNTKRTIRITGDSPPTEQELNNIFQTIGKQQPQQEISKLGFGITPFKRVQQEFFRGRPSLLEQVAIGAGETAGLGFPSRIIGQERFQRLTGKTGLEKVARGVGTVAGFISPGGGPAALLRAGGRLGGKLGAKAIPRALQAGRFGKFIEPIARGIGAGAGGFTALEAGTAPREGEGILEKLKALPAAAGFGALTGGLGGLVRAIPKIPIQKIKGDKIVDRELGTVLTKNFNQFLEGILSFTTPESVDQNVISRLLQRGVKNIWTAFNKSRDAYLQMGRRVRGRIEGLRRQRGKVVGNAKKRLLTRRGEFLSVENARTKFAQESSDIIRRQVTVENLPVTLQRTPIQTIEQKVTDFNRRLSVGRLRVIDTLDLIDDIDDTISFGKTGQMVVRPNEQRILANLRNDLANNIGKLGDEGKAYAKAKSSFKEIADLWDDFGRGLDDSQVAGRLKASFADTPNSAIQLERINRLNNFLPQNLKFFEQLKDVHAVQTVKPMVLHGIRAGLLGSIGRGALVGTGLGAIGGGSPQAAALGGLVGAVSGGFLSTPRGVAALISAGQTGAPRLRGALGGVAAGARRLAPPLILEQRRRRQGR